MLIGAMSHQDIILKNLVKFIEVLEQTEPDIDKEIIKKIKYLFDPDSHARSGHCFSFALCAGAMDEMGLLPWWEAALKTIYSIKPDEITPEKLKEEVLLPQANEGKAIKLNELFNRMVNYIFYNFSHLGTPWTVASTQERFLRNPKNFDFLKEGNINKLKQRKVVAGNFDEFDFDTLFGNGDPLKNHIWLIHSPGHTMRISFSDGKWKIYDPDEDFANESFQMSFDDKSDFIKKLFRQLKTSSIAFEVVSLKDKPPILLPKIDLSNASIVKRHLRNFGLHQILTFKPDLLTTFIDWAWKDKSINDQLADFLLRVDEADWNGWHTAIQYAPKYFSDLIDVIKINKKCDEYFVYALQRKVKDVDGLEHLFYAAPEQADSVLRIVIQHKSGPNAIAKLLTKVYPDTNLNALQTVVNNVSEQCLLDVLGKIENQNIRYLSKALDYISPDGESGYQTLVKRYPVFSSHPTILKAIKYDFSDDSLDESDFSEDDESLISDVDKGDRSSRSHFEMFSERPFNPSKEEIQKRKRESDADSGDDSLVKQSRNK